MSVDYQLLTIVVGSTAAVAAVGRSIAMIIRETYNGRAALLRARHGLPDLKSVTNARDPTVVNHRAKPRRISNNDK